MNLRILARNVWKANVEKGMTPHSIGAIQTLGPPTLAPILVDPGTTVHLNQVHIFLNNFHYKQY